MKDATLQALEHRVLNHLKAIYPEADHNALTLDCLRLMRLDRECQPPRRQLEKWDQQDAFVIVYGDTFVEPSQHPLHVLHQFLDDYVKDSINSVHILPFFPYSSDDGFAVVDNKTVNPSLGDWADIQDIAEKYRVMADVVINHCSQENQWFRNFIDCVDPGRDYFFTASPQDDLSLVVRPRTSELLKKVETPEGDRHVWCTFGHDQVDFDFSNPQVLLEFIKIIRLYLDNGVSCFRLDAVAFIWKEIGTNCLNLPQTHEIVRLLRALIEHAEPSAIIITETNIPKRENLTYFGNANEAHAIYNFSLPPLLVYTLLSGDCGYLKSWLMTMPPAQLGTFYFNFIASHDGIGLRPAEGLLTDTEIEALLNTMLRYGGEISWRALSGIEKRPYEINISLFDALKGTLRGEDQFQFQRFISAHTIMLALEGIPAFYVQSLLATGNNQDRYARTGHKRHLNRSQWPYAELKRLLADPESVHARVLKELKRLMTIRSRQAAFHPNATQFTLHMGSRIFAFWRQSIQREQSIFCLNNISDQPCQLDLAEVNLIDTENWGDLITGKMLDSHLDVIELAPYQTVWLTNRLYA
ncbi:MAG: alpha-amylase family glycosyl hydrolase [Gammaproteobacteria bacterium]|jgi:sucrose phosphorylase